MTGPIDLSVGQLSCAAILILANALVSLRLQLGLEKKLLLVTLRSILQLTLLGFALRYIFAVQSPLLVFLLMMVMGTMAGIEAVRRTTRRVPGLMTASISVVLATGMAITLYGVVAVIGVDPWWTPRYILPVLGMVLGNSLTGISLGVETALDGFDRDRNTVEMLLAHGANRKEASQDIVQRAVSTGMIPILNAMAVAGIVSIPGMMTGQLIAGADPLVAAKYQLFILFSIAGGVALGTIAAVSLVTRLVFDERERLRTDRIRRH